MTADRGAAAEDDLAAGIAEVEGYLLAQAEIGAARREAESFARLLPWLTTAQREDLTLRYAQERLAQSRIRLRAVAERCRELEEQYDTRYLALRQRLLCTCVALLLTALSVCAALCALAVDGTG
ncbi:hypothetical protein [Streptomyces sp. NBC_01190]|uniref:hypothetical protein n=1 Tax=Streptomyces sp. NBC_01190 TaxID=2903767 RepID=UPI003866C1B9|nr:hypothetical protein OG519_32255 [Streptomyces sp. NBC_01190]